MKALTKLGAFFDGTIGLPFVLAGVLLMFVMLATSIDVAIRYFLNRPIVWLMEVSEAILVYVTFLGCAWVLKREGHVRIDLLLKQLKPKTQALLNMVTSVLAAIVFAPVVWYSAQVTLEYLQTGRYERTYLMIPTGIILAVIPVGTLLLLIQLLRNAYGYFERLRVSPDDK